MNKRETHPGWYSIYTILWIFNVFNSICQFHIGMSKILSMLKCCHNVFRPKISAKNKSPWLIPQLWFLKHIAVHLCCRKTNTLGMSFKYKCSQLITADLHPFVFYKDVLTFNVLSLCSQVHILSTASILWQMVTKPTMQPSISACLEFDCVLRNFLHRQLSTCESIV